MCSARYAMYRCWPTDPHADLNERLMLDNTSATDPEAILRALLRQWETVLNERINEAMSTDEFSRNVNQAIVASIGAQRSMGDLLERYLRLLNLPSRADVASFDARMRSVEEKLDLVLHRLSQPPIAPKIRVGENLAVPPRTKRPPAGA